MRLSPNQIQTFNFMSDGKTLSIRLEDEKGNEQSLFLLDKRPEKRAILKIKKIRGSLIFPKGILAKSLCIEFKDEREFRNSLRKLQARKFPHHTY